MALRRAWDALNGRVQRTDEIPEGFNVASSAWQSQISEFWGGMSGVGFSPTLIDKVWVANHCLQLTADAISSMTLRFYGNRQPAWVANPDPVWFPGGIGDAVFALVWSVDAWGDAFGYVTARYADGYPQNWTVLDPAYMSVESRRGRRAYRYNEKPLNSEDVLQISRDPRAGSLKGTSALKSYSGQAYGLIAANDLGRVMMQSEVPQYALKAQRKVTKEQAEGLQSQWMTRTAARRGAPPVLPPDIDLEKLGLSPQDLMLLDAQKFTAQVIATAYGVPAQMINMAVEGGLTYSTPVLMLEQWWRSSLRPKAYRISRALSSVMLPAGSYVEFDAREFLAPTYADLADALSKLTAAGILTAEEARIIILNAPPEGAALADLATPPSAGASPAQIPSNVAALRPTGTIS